MTVNVGYVMLWGDAPFKVDDLSWFLGWQVCVSIFGRVLLSTAHRFLLFLPPVLHLRALLTGVAGWGPATSGGSDLSDRRGRVRSGPQRGVCEVLGI